MFSPMEPSALEPEPLRAAVAEANLPTLVPVLFQLTGEQRWLRDPYRPTRARGLDDHPTGGFSAEVRVEIREAAVRAIMDWAGGRPPAVPVPDLDLLRELLTLCTGEPVPAEYARMMHAEMGFAPTGTDRLVPAAPENAGEFSVIIIGAGVSGLAAAVQLRAAGIPFVVLERDSDVGGVWLRNRYPGAGVDTPSYLYSLSFFPRNWSTQFAKRAEVAEYLRELADHFDLRRDIRLGVDVREARYDEENQHWTVTYRDPDGGTRDIVANAVISAVGLFNQPAVPDLPGMDDFHGPLLHTARWPDDVDVEGKSVAVVGTGASAMQVVPAIANRARAVTIFQRSPQWIAPSSNYFSPIGAGVHWLMRNVPFYHQWYRFRLAWTFNDKTHASLRIDPEWENPRLSLNEVNDGHRRYFTRYLKEQLDGRPDLIAKSLPDYPPFGKRILLDNGWYRALRKPNVELVTDAVSAVTTTGVRTSSGQQYEADIVALATGFDARRYLGTLTVRGRGEQSLRERWGDDDASAHLGITTPGFPNLFFLYGPNTNPGAGGSVIFNVECQIRYIVQLLVTMLQERAGSVECRQEAHDRYVREVDQAHSTMIWSHPGMRTYYRNSRGRVVTNTPWRVVDYWAMTRSPNPTDFWFEPARGTSDAGMRPPGDESIGARP